MAIRPFRSHTTRGLSPPVRPSSVAGRIGLCLTALLILAPHVNAQLQQPFGYTAGGAIATRDDDTGVLAPTSFSRLAVLGFPAVLDAKGRHSNRYQSLRKSAANTAHSADADS
jgi:hypothetical protein